MRRIDAGMLSGLSPYLQTAKQFAEKNAHLIMAIDLEDVLSVDEVKARLATFESLEGKGIDLDKASQALASIRGVTLGLTVTDRRSGALRVDFNEDISVIRDVAKPLFVEAPGNHGMMINEFRDWNVQVSEKEVRLTGILEDGGTRLSAVFLDTPPSLQLAEDQPAAESRRRSHRYGSPANSTSNRLDRCWETCANAQTESHDHGSDQRLFPQLRSAD